jgi:hypothetical protein
MHHHDYLSSTTPLDSLDHLFPFVIQPELFSIPGLDQEDADKDQADLGLRRYPRHGSEMGGVVVEYGIDSDPFFSSPQRNGF